jgi:hypothetical protein
LNGSINTKKKKASAVNVSNSNYQTGNPAAAASAAATVACDNSEEYDLLDTSLDPALLQVLRVSHKNKKERANKTLFTRRWISLF